MAQDSSEQHYQNLVKEAIAGALSAAFPDRPSIPWHDDGTRTIYGLGTRRLFVSENYIAAAARNRGVPTPESLSDVIEAIRNAAPGKTVKLGSDVRLTVEDD